MSARDTVNHVRLNQDGGVFACALDSGVRVFNLEPLCELASFGFTQFGSIALCELLHRTNLLAVVGGGSMPRFADNTVLIYDMSGSVFLHELTFSSPVLDVRMRRDCLVVVERDQVHVFTLPSVCRRLISLASADNAAGLCAVTPLTAGLHQLLVFPAVKTGALQLFDLRQLSAAGSGAGSGVSSAPGYISAHQSALAAIAIDQQGTMVATASRVGTLVRVWCSVSRSLLLELRRGADTAVLRCLQFSGGAGAGFLCCCSDKATVHVFAVRRPLLNRRSALARLGVPAGQYMRSQWALATCTLLGAEKFQCVCAFGAVTGHSAGHSLYAVCADGTLHKYLFSVSPTADSAVGCCTRQAFDVYLDVCGAADF